MAGAAGGSRCRNPLFNRGTPPTEQQTGQRGAAGRQVVILFSIEEHLQLYTPGFSAYSRPGVVILFSIEEHLQLIDLIALERTLGRGS